LAIFGVKISRLEGEVTKAGEGNFIVVKPARVSRFLGQG